MSCATSRQNPLQRFLVVVRLILLGLLGSAFGAPAVAAPQVITTAESLEAWEMAPAPNRLPGMQRAELSSASVQLLLRLDRTNGVLIARLPPEVPDTVAKRWLQHTADQLAWSTPRLTLHRRSGESVLRMEGGNAVSQTSATSSRLLLITPPLEAGFAGLPAGPVSLCIRLPGAKVLSRSVTPLQEGREGRDYYLVYLLASRTNEPLIVEFGFPPHWWAAVAVSLFLWILAPFGVAWGAQAYLIRYSLLAADKQVFLLDRIMLASRFTAVAGFYFTVTTLDLHRLEYLGDPTITRLSGGSIMLAPFWFWCKGAEAMLRKGLVRRTGTESNSGDSDALSHLVIAICGVFFFLTPGFLGSPTPFVPTLRPPAPGEIGPPIAGWLLIGGGAVLLIVLLPFHLLITRKLPASPLPPIPEDPAPLKSTLRELTLTYSKAPGPLSVGFALDPDQQIALGAAAQLYCAPMGRGDRRSLGSVLGVPALLVSLGIWQCLHPTPGLQFTQLFWVLVVIGGLAALGWALRQRRRATRLEEIDLKIALAMEDPRRYLDALRKLAKHEEVRPAIPGSVLTPFFNGKWRVQRLERRLHLD